MGRRKKERKESSSEDDSISSKEEAQNSSSESDNNAKEKEELEEAAGAAAAASAERISKRDKKKQTRDSNMDKNAGRSRWESPDSRKRRHSPSGSQNQEKRKSGQRDRQDGSKKSDKNEKEKETDRDIEKKRKEDENRINKNERRDLHDRDYQHRENNRNQERERERAPQSHQRNDNRENQNRPNDKFERQRSSPQRREDRNRRFDDRDNKQNNRTNNERGRRGGGRGRSNRFSNNEGPRSRFDGSRIKSEPSPEWGKAEIKNEGDEKGPIEKEKPNFEPSGKLTEDANTVNGVVIKYTEPLESRKPKRRWRLYPFKGEKALPTLYVHRQSAFLMGRDRKVADIPLDHPSCSKQHAALQFRLVPFAREDGGEGKRVRPYLIDLESANGTFVNDVKLEARRYHELLERDVLKFGFSSREYVLLHEQSKDDALDDDVDIPGVKQE